MSLDDLFKQRETQTSMQFIQFRNIRDDSSSSNRDIDWNYVDQLKAANSSQLPPIDVMHMPNGNYYNLLDGQHRWWSIFYKIIETRQNMPAREDYGEDYQSLSRYIRDCLSCVDDTIHARVWPALTAWEVQLFRFWRNRDHGLGSSIADRKEMARALRQQSPMLTLEQIAGEVRLSASTVSKALNDTGLKTERQSDGLRDTRAFCGLVERLYDDGFILREQRQTREEWLRNDSQLCKAYEGIARQMLKDVEAARK